MHFAIGFDIMKVDFYVTPNKFPHKSSFIKKNPELFPFSFSSSDIVEKESLNYLIRTKVKQEAILLDDFRLYFSQANQTGQTGV